MKTDRELLELAAKGAMISIIVDGDDLLSENGFWNPLAKDDDALRLAVKLGIQVIPGTYNPEEASAYRAGVCEAHEFGGFQQDMAAATRRAIVRAAAEMGARPSVA